MTRAVIAGSLHKPVEMRTSKAGKPYATFTACESVNGSRRFWRGVAFDEAAIAALKELPAGSPIALGGELDCEIYRPENAEPKLSWSLKVDGVLTASKLKSAARETATRSSAAPDTEGVDDTPF
jgi:hypothetical protein